MVDKFSLAEQLKYHRAHNDWKAAQKKAEAEKNKPKEVEKKDEEFRILTNDEVKALPFNK